MLQRHVTCVQDTAWHAEAFNWCDPERTNHCTPSWNQHNPNYCGSCFAHGALSMIQDRMKIMKGGMDVQLSRQTFLNCAPPLGFSDGCGGGDVIDVRPLHSLCLCLCSDRCGGGDVCCSPLALLAGRECQPEVHGLGDGARP